MATKHARRAERDDDSERDEHPLARKKQPREAESEDGNDGMTEKGREQLPSEEQIKEEALKRLLVTPTPERKAQVERDIERVKNGEMLQAPRQQPEPTVTAATIDGVPQARPVVQVVQSRRARR